MVRAKVRLVAITAHEAGPRTLVFETRYDDSIPEDVRFTKATPWGRFEMQVDSPAAIAQFELGKDYYVEFAEVAVAT